MNGATFAKNFLTYVPISCTDSLTDPGVEEALKHDYDYVIMQIMFTECFLPIPFSRKIPLIYATPNTLTPPDPEYIGVPNFVSITPSRTNEITFPFSFSDKLTLIFESILAKLFMEYLSKLTYYRAIEENLWPSEAPDVFDLKLQSSLTIINSVRALEYPMRPMPPNVIYAGGIHIKEFQPLQKDLCDWLDDSGDEGFIFFSLGTGIKPEHIDPNHLSVMVEVFGSLKQKVIWKWSSEIEDLPPNVKISSWLPQQDILAHPKIKLMITHGGIFSTQEATYYEVPVLGIPIYYDQIMNIAEVVKEGWGRSLKWEGTYKRIFL
ncbi:2-hydroxyacylsphingosine 1-beta-galactosyltransferase [Armadillidium nasatum]|uniref:2-hydroxyacylsphingosine 1-beta-galactosyltransferase n=1 Tax=Armadillidium nasatum TaxID=96803 RepID=A0A5N5SVG0_9CRUS|nr:2-hydroxyacylsphingosine 1-beta-galactosyltransferase [Armadillidium nasatum]